MAAKQYRDDRAGNQAIDSADGVSAEEITTRGSSSNKARQSGTVTFGTSQQGRVAVSAKFVVCQTDEMSTVKFGSNCSSAG
jgi:hypothetical protein